MFAETGNYRQATAAAEAAYRAAPGLALDRGLGEAAFLLAATLLGLITAVRQAWRAAARRRVLLLFLLATLFQSAGLLLAVPLPWQRYSLPLVPFACLWAGAGLAWLLSGFSIKGIIGWFARVKPAQITQD
jgi:hypothetical protein